MSVGLFKDMARPERRTTGILPSQEIRELMRTGKIRSAAPISDDQIQPATLDLRLGKVAHRVQASFLPGRSATIGAKIRDFELAEVDLSKPALLEKGAVFIIPVIESLTLPGDISARANPKSTTGRLDIFTRLIADGGLGFDQIREGYSGDLYVEVVSRTFPIVVRASVCAWESAFHGRCIARIGPERETCFRQWWQPGGARNTAGAADLHRPRRERETEHRSLQSQKDYSSRGPE